MSDQSAPLDLDGLRVIAEAPPRRDWIVADRGNNYPQQVISLGDVTLIAECYEGPPHLPTLAPYIATFDPPTTLALIDAARQAVAATAALSAEERRRLGCQCWRLDGDWHHVRGCPVPEVEAIMAERRVQRRPVADNTGTPPTAKE